MKKSDGWLFDVYVEDSRAVLWVKTEDRNLLRLTDDYTPFFHIKPKDSSAEKELLYQFSDCREVESVSLEEKVTSLERKRPERLIRVEARGARGFRALVEALVNSPLVSKLYDVDLKHVQRYLFTRLKVEPTSKVEVEHDEHRISKIRKLDDSIEIIPPPFKMLRFRVGHDTTEQGMMIDRITVYSGDNEKHFEGSEKHILTSFSDYVNDLDVDLLFCPKCDDTTYPLLKDRAQKNEAPLRLGRYDDREQVRLQGSLAGRIMLGDVFYGFNADEWGIAGLVERVRFSFIPIGLATRWLSNKSIDSRNCFELIQRGYAIPREEYFESARELRDLASGDRAGITITSEIGTLHENVAALDFDSQYPNIILKNELSYEPENKSKNESFRLIPTAIGPWLERRLFLKRIRRGLPKGSALRLYCEQRVDALKLILVTQYGIAGCCWNRFGNVLTFEQINRVSRYTMLEAKALAENLDFRIVYADVDSIFASKVGATREDYEKLVTKIADATGLPMSLDRHFRFLAFLPLKGDKLSSAMKRYFGLTYDGEVEARGIELRRHDTPKFIRDLQVELIKKILDYGSLHEVYSSGVRWGVDLIKQELEVINSGRARADELVTKKKLRKELDQYKVKVAHRSAALQLLHLRKELEVGEDIPFLYVDQDHKDPSRRVRIPERFTGSYDSGAYAKMLLQAASTVFEGLGIELDLNGGETTLGKWF